MIGSDIGGYLDRDDQDLLDLVPYDGEVFLRWLALGAMTPFMQLHGRANLEPWAVPERVDETIAAYKYWATLHSELVPFWYSLAQEAYAGAATMMSTIGDGPSDWSEDWRYQIGDAFVVAAVFESGTERDVALPAGRRWYDWWNPQNAPIEGGGTTTVDLSNGLRIPIFVAEGAIIPMAIASDVTGIGAAESAGSDTVVVYPGREPRQFRRHDEDGMITVLEAQDDGAVVQIRASRLPKSSILRVRTDRNPTSVTADGRALSRDVDFSVDEAQHFTEIRLSAQASESVIELR